MFAAILLREQTTCETLAGKQVTVHENDKLLAKCFKITIRNQSISSAFRRVKLKRTKPDETG
jgi:transposase